MEPISKLKPDFCREIKDENLGLVGFVVIDRLLNGFAIGGVRMAEGLTLEEVANLAHEMTLKFAFLNIKKDGAKAGIVAPPALTKQKKAKLCEAFGKSISDLIREEKYSPGEDLGISSEDLSNILLGAGIDYSKYKNEIRSEYFTALTVFLSAQELLIQKGLTIKGLSVIIEGFGKVGEQTARLFSKAGAKIIGISTLAGALFDNDGLDIEKICYLKKTHGDMLIDYYQKDKRIDRSCLLLQKTDILIPGARPDSINFENINEIKAGIIVPIANIAATEAIEHMLFERGIIYIPGFVSNCGGVLADFLEEQGFNNNEVENIIRNGFPQKLKKLLEKTNNSKKAISDVAREKAFENIKHIELDNKTPKIKKIGIGRIGWFIYKRLTRIHLSWFLKPFARQYIIKRLFQ